MAAQALIEQHIFIISASDQFNEADIWGNALIQSLAANSLGGDVKYGYSQYANWNGSAWAYSSAFEMACYIQPAFQATVQANIPTLQAQLPQYTIVTWGINTQFGN